jgi:N-acetylmuramoyl-L-alanine amidase/Mannosyl-glycoprotein endo-beta-N-acetylglucosaminidase
MGRIFLSAGHGSGDSGAIAGGTTEAREMILLRDQILPELRAKGIEVLSVPDDRTLKQSITWINDRARKGDIALEIHADAFDNPGTRGASIFYLANNNERKNQAQLVLLALLRRVPQIPSRGAKPDTATGVGRLGFCRDITIPSLLLEVGFLTNSEDRNILQNRRKEMAQGIADGLAAWSRAIGGNNPNSEPVGKENYPEVNISINNQIYSEKGILINNNAHIPVDLVDRLKINLSEIQNLRRVQYRGIVYIKAIELRDFHISIGWDAANRTVILRSILSIPITAINHIMGNGYTSEVQLMMFLKSNNEQALNQFPDLAKLYREEAAIEGVNYDLAFCQMCLETNFLRFGGDVKATQNNFAGLGTVGGGIEGASFPSSRIGVRAHIQHLKAYASLEPLVQELVDPRYRFVTRGIAPLIDQLSGRWAADLQYGTKIISLVKRLYESANLL